MKKVRIYIASPTGLRTDVTEIGDFIRRLNDCYLDRDIYFTLITQSDIDSALDGSADTLASCDLAFFLFSAEADGAARRDFDAALECRRKFNKPHVVTYFRTQRDAPQPEEAARFIDQLSRETDGYGNTYAHIDTLKLGLLMQIRQLELDGVELRLEDGYVRQGGTALLELGNVEMVSGYEELESLKSEHAALEERFYAAKTKYAENPDDNDAYEIFYEAARQRSEAMQKIRDIETRLYHMIEGMYEQTSRGKLSKRQLEGYRLMERGRFREAQLVLDFDSIVSENRHNEALADKTDKRAQVHVSELMQLIDVDMTLGDWDGVDACYCEAVRLEERHILPKKAMLAYVRFLYDQNRYAEGIATAEKLQYLLHSPDSKAADEDKGRLYYLLAMLYADAQRMTEAEEILKSAIEIFEKLTERALDTYGTELSDSYNQLGVLFSKTQRLADAEGMYKSALDIQQRLSERKPEAYEPLLAEIHDYLGELYRETQRIQEAEEMYRYALEIRKRLAEKSPDVYEPHIATTCNNLGALYDETQRYEECEVMFKASLNIREKLVSQNPDAYEPVLSDTLNNLGLLYFFTERYAESEEMHRASIEIRKRLAGRNPEVFERRLANSYNSLGSLYTTINRYVEAESMFKSSLGIRLRLSERNPDMYEEYVTDCYSNLGSVYQETGKLTEAEGMFNAAIEILRRLAARNPSAYEMDLADICFNKGNLLKLASRREEAEEQYNEALRLYYKYADVNPYCAGQASETRKEMAGLNDMPDNKGTVDFSSLLTAEEREIALLLTEGVTQRDIARKLKLTAADVSRRVNAIREKVAGAGSPDPGIAAIAYEYKLSGREAHILECLSRGMSNAEIAAELFITEETVRVHTHRLIKKLPVENRQDVAAWVGAFRDKME